MTQVKADCAKQRLFTLLWLDILGFSSYVCETHLTALLIYTQTDTLMMILGVMLDLSIFNEYDIYFFSETALKLLKTNWYSQVLICLFVFFLLLLLFRIQTCWILRI